MIRHKKPTVAERAEEAQKQRAAVIEEKRYLEAKYDKNQIDSDDSSDEEVLLRTGNVPEKWYELYEHRGYTVGGKQVIKLPQKDELEKFMER